MNSKMVERWKIGLEKAALVITLTICTILPFISYPKITLVRTLDNVDCFTYYKSLFLYALAVLAFLILLSYCLISKNKIKVKTTLLLFTLWIALSTYFSYDQKTSFYGYGLNNMGLLTYLSLFIIYNLIINCFKKTYLNLIIYMSLASSSMMSILSISEYYNFTLIENLFSNKYHFTSQVHATFGNSNCVGSYFSLMTPLAVMLFIRSQEKYKKFLFLLFSLINIIGLVVSMSRISWISVFISCICCLIISEERRLYFKKMFILIVPILAITLILDFSNHSVIKGHFIYTGSQIKEAFTSDIDKLGSYRLYIYKKFIRLNLWSPRNALIGVGPDSLYLYGNASVGDRIKYPVFINATLSQAHSEFLEYSVTMGIPALMLYICFILSIILPCIKRLNNSTPETMGIFASCIAYLLQSAFNITSIGVISIFFVYCALIDERSSVATRGSSFYTANKRAWDT